MLAHWLIGVALGAAPVPSARVDSTVPCVRLVTGLDAKVRADYAGFLLEIRGPRLEAYQRALAKAAAQAATVDGPRCFGVLDSLVGFFHDPHLFIWTNPALDTVEARRRMAAVTRVAVTESALRRELSGRGAHDPLEGIWYDGELRLGIMPAPGHPRGEFVAVVLHSDTSTWQAGEVRARFTRQGPGAYLGTVWGRNFSERVVHATLHKHTMLRLSPGIWGKAFPVAAADSGLVGPVDPHAATFQLRNGTAILSVPSHDPTYRAALDSILRQYHDVLLHSDRLIVDLRGNEGGSSGVTDGLKPWILSDSARAPYVPARTNVAPDHGAGMMLSSPDQLRYAARIADTTDPSARRFMQRMREHPGALVPFYDSLDPPSTPRHDPVTYGPRRVGILVDGGTVSAAEVLVLDAWRSTRATIFGEPTAGALDYESVSIVALDPVDHRWALGYPTITANPDLPAHGMRGRGIRPQVALDLTRTPDPIAAVDAALRREP